MHYNNFTNYAVSICKRAQIILTARHKFHGNILNDRAVKCLLRGLFYTPSICRSICSCSWVWRESCAKAGP